LPRLVQSLTRRAVLYGRSAGVGEYDASEKSKQRVHRLSRILVKQPMAGVAENDDCHIGSDELDLLSERDAIGALASDGENGHGQSSLRQLGEVLRSLWERREACPTGAHPTRPGVGRDIGVAIRLRNGASAVRRELVPIVVEVVPLTSFDQQLG